MLLPDAVLYTLLFSVTELCPALMRVIVRMGVGINHRDDGLKGANMGTPLSSRFDVETDLCYLLVSDQLIFYCVVEESHAEVTHVLNSRQDYISILF